MCIHSENDFSRFLWAENIADMQYAFDREIVKSFIEYLIVLSEARRNVIFSFTLQ